VKKGATIPQATTTENENEIALDSGVAVKYKVGDKVVYPHHGAGKVLKKEKKEMLGHVREYLTIKILHNDMTVMVPSDSASRAGLRRVIGESAVRGCSRFCGTTSARCQRTGTAASNTTATR